MWFFRKTEPTLETLRVALDLAEQEGDQRHVSDLTDKIRYAIRDSRLERAATLVAQQERMGRAGPLAMR